MNEKVISGCVGKTPYRSNADALCVIRHREKSNRVHSKGRGKLTTYKCRHCRAWHIGSESA